MSQASIFNLNNQQQSVKASMIKGKQKQEEEAQKFHIEISKTFATPASDNACVC